MLQKINDARYETLRNSIELRAFENRSFLFDKYILLVKKIQMQCTAKKQATKTITEVIVLTYYSHEIQLIPVYHALCVK